MNVLALSSQPIISAFLVSNSSLSSEVLPHSSVKYISFQSCIMDWIVSRPILRK